MKVGSLVWTSKFDTVRIFVRFTNDEIGNQKKRAFEKHMLNKYRIESDFPSFMHILTWCKAHCIQTYVQYEFNYLDPFEYLINVRDRLRIVVLDYIKDKKHFIKSFYGHDFGPQERMFRNNYRIWTYIEE